MRRSQGGIALVMMFFCVSMLLPNVETVAGVSFYAIIRRGDPIICGNSIPRKADVSALEIVLDTVTRPWTKHDEHDYFRAKTAGQVPLWYEVFAWMPSVLMVVGLVTGYVARWRPTSAVASAAFISASVWMIDFETRSVQFHLYGYYCWLGSMWLLAALSSTMVLLARRDVVLQRSTFT